MNLLGWLTRQSNPDAVTELDAEVIQMDPKLSEATVKEMLEELLKRVESKTSHKMTRDLLRGKLQDFKLRFEAVLNPRP